jgi:hypothetical protein
VAPPIIQGNVFKEEDKMLTQETTKDVLRRLQIEFQDRIEEWFRDDDSDPLSPHVLKPLEDCNDPLGESYCEMLGLSRGSSIADAVQSPVPKALD